MYKIALMGNRETIIGFKLLGISIFPVKKKEESVEILNKLVREEYAVIFVTEEIGGQIIEEIETLQKTSFTSITIIPSKSGKEIFGIKDIKK